jgi:hypothetical protein
MGGNAIYEEPYSYCALERIEIEDVFLGTMLPEAIRIPIYGVVSLYSTYSNEKQGLPQTPMLSTRSPCRMHWGFELFWIDTPSRFENCNGGVAWGLGLDEYW